MQFDSKGPAIRVKDISDFEALVNVVLPDSYRSFLLTHNGGIPTPDIIDIPGLLSSPTDVQVLFGIGRPVESSNLAWNITLAEERCVGFRVLPFACDSGGNLFCFEIERGFATKVIYLDFDTQEAASYTVAQSFQELIDRMRSMKSDPPS